MVTQFGMSDAVGNVDYSDERESYLGNYSAGASAISSETQKLIESEVRRLVETGMETAHGILTDKAEEFELLAQGLLEYETLTGEEIRKVIAGEPLNRDEDGSSDSGGTPLTSVPKTKKPKPDADGGGLEPVPT